MKIGIFYFSGTGNTKKIVEEAVRAFETSGCAVDVFPLETLVCGGTKIELDAYDKVGIAYPVHAFNAPHIVLEFVKQVEKLSEKKDLFILKTSGEPLALNNSSSLKTVSILKRRGLVLQSEYHYCMPYNILFRHSDGTAYQMWSAAKEVIPIDCGEILTGKKVKLPSVPFGRLLAWIFRIEHWGGRFNGRRYQTDENCIQCGRCVSRCPVHNIKSEGGKITFGKRCLMCMRCSFFCPKNAIKIGLFEKCKVNGAYTFEKSDSEELHSKYCRRAYRKYFARMQRKANSASER